MSEKKKLGALGWMAGNHVASNLLMLVFVIGGLLVMFDIKQEVFPEYDLDFVDISISYPGASPTEVEEGIILAVEEQIRGLDNVESVTAFAWEGSAKISVELLAGVDTNKSLQEIKSAIDRIRSIPEDAERPNIRLRKRRRSVVRLALYGDVDERTLYYSAQSIKEELLGLPSVTQLELRGVRKPEISIEIPQSSLRSYGLTLGEIAKTIRRQAVNVPAGGIKTAGGEILIRTSERRDFASEFGDIALISSRDGAEVRLGDIANITDGFEDSYREAYFDGQRAILLYIYQSGEQKPIQISKEVHEYVDRLKPSLPESIDLKLYRDRSELYKDRLDLLLKNGGMGLILVLIILSLFLEARLAFWVAMGIPISIIGSFVVIYAIGGSINMVSLFAFIITLGIIVDDAVVVGESIHHERQKGLDPLAAAITGGAEMSSAVTFAVATNIVAFMPLMFVPGSTGKFFSILPVVIISVFLISLIECLFILPSHLVFSHKARGTGVLRFFNYLPRVCSRGMERFVENYFTPVVRYAVVNRYLTVAVSISVLIVAYAYWDSGHINFSFRPKIQTDRIDAEVTLPYGAPIADVKRVANLIEAGGLRAAKKSGGRRIIAGAHVDIGRRGPNTAEVTFNLVPQDQREISTKKFSVMWRKEVGEIAGLESLFFDYLVGPGGSSAINLELTHPDPKTLELAAADLAHELHNYDGVTDINDGFAQGKRQYAFKMTPEGRSLGLTANELGSQVRHAFYGAEALRQQRGRDEVKVMVRLPESERKSIYNLEELLIKTPSGGEVPLTRAASLTTGRAYTEIQRVDGKRVLNVTANVIPGVANENKIIAGLKADYLKRLPAKYPGLEYSFAGRQKEKRKALRSLIYGLGFALLGIFTLLATLFRSYMQAIMVMTSIMFGMASALLGHVIMGYELSIISLFGMIALCGVVVNGGLVLTVTANRLSDNGADPLDAAIKAGIRRFRPIILTALTTFFGLAPMIFESSVQARFLIPMAISLGYGILFTTVVVLLLMPALYVIHQDFRKLF